jgi:hypothetical protein
LPGGTEENENPQSALSLPSQILKKGKSQGWFVGYFLIVYQLQRF